MCARFETPSTYAGQATGATSTSSPPTEWRLERRHERVEERALLFGERRAQVLRDHVLARPVAEAPRERLGVPERDPRIAERAGVLVDPEGEDGRLERRHLDLALGEDPDHRRRQRAVVGEHEVLGLDPVRRLAGMVVEDDDLDPGIARDPLELAEALRVHGLDDDQPPDRAEVDPAGLARSRARPRAGGRTRARCG